MTEDRYFSDEELVAYLDGEVDFAPVDEITAALNNDTALIQRVEALRVDTAMIADSFEALAISDRARPDLPITPPATTPYRQIAAAAAVALMVGYGAGYSTSDSNQANWETYVAAYQALYTNSTLAPVNQSEAAKQIELDRVAAAIGKDIKTASLQVSPEIDYKRGQVLGYEGKALIQLAFLSSTGEPMALCIIRSQKPNSKDVSISKMEGMSAASWSKDGYEFLLIGGTDYPLITRLAEKFSKASI